MTTTEWAAPRQRARPPTPSRRNTHSHSQQPHCRSIAIDHEDPSQGMDEGPSPPLCHTRERPRGAGEDDGHHAPGCCADRRAALHEPHHGDPREEGRARRPALGGLLDGRGRRTPLGRRRGGLRRMEGGARQDVRDGRGARAEDVRVAREQALHRGDRERARGGVRHAARAGALCGHLARGVCRDAQGAPHERRRARPGRGRRPARPRGPPGERRLAREGRRDAGEEPGLLRILLVVQRDRGHRVRERDRDGQARRALGAGARVVREERQRGLPRRRHEAGDGLDHLERRHRHRGGLPVPRDAEPVALLQAEEADGRQGGEHLQVPAGAPERQQAAAGGGGHRGPRLRGHRRHRALPVLQGRRHPGQGLRRPAGPRRAPGGLRRRRRDEEAVLAREELLGRALGRGRVLQGTAAAGPRSVDAPPPPAPSGASDARRAPPACARSPRSSRG